MLAALFKSCSQLPIIRLELSYWYNIFSFTTYTHLSRQHNYFCFHSDMISWQSYQPVDQHTTNLSVAAQRGEILHLACPPKRPSTKMQFVSLTTAKRDFRNRLLHLVRHVLYLFLNYDYHQPQNFMRFCLHFDSHPLPSSTTKLNVFSEKCLTSPTKAWHLTQFCSIWILQRI